MCDLETSRIGAPYIYDISNLRVKVCCKGKRKFYTFLSVKAPTVEHKARDRMKLQKHTGLRDVNNAVMSLYKNYILSLNIDMINFIFDLGHI